jgi:hypothetical protein
MDCQIATNYSLIFLRVKVVFIKDIFYSEFVKVLHWRADELDHSSPELIAHLKPVVYICYHVYCIFDLQTGQIW